MREQNKLLVNKYLSSISTVVILLLFVTRVSFAQCTTDLALGKAVTSSGVVANNYAYYATDGNTTTRWESVYSDPQWIMVDLGGRYPICTVNITWEDARGKDFLVQVSDDGSTWRTKATVTGNTALTNSYSFTDTARYVRMYGTARVLTGYGYSIYTLEVLGTAPTTICSNTNVAQSRPGYASSVVGTNTIANAFDNSTTTRWESASSDPQYLYVDLGAQYDLCRVTLLWEAAYGKDFTIDISTNGTTWTTAATVVGNYIKNNSIAISGTARYVRMYGTARGTNYGFSLYDFAVYAMLPALSVTKLTDGAEPGTNGSFRLSLPTGITYSDNITVNYTVTGTATNGTDYINLPASAVIPAGSNYVDITYNTSDDKIIEGDETVIVTLTGGTSGTSTTYSTFPLSSTDYTATSTINDDDNIASNKVVNVTMTTAASEPSTNGAFTVSLPTGYTSKEDVTVHYTVASTGTATAGTDYTALTGTITLPAGSNSVSLPVTVIDDKIIEGSEWLQVALDDAAASTLGTFAVTGNARLYIADDDNVAGNKVLSIVSTGDAAEPSTNGGFAISLPTGITVAEDVTVNYTVTGTATANADYVGLTGTVTLPAGSNSVSLPVTVIDDNDIEATETVIATLNGGTSSTFGAFSGTTNATVNITDNDDAPVNRTVSVTATTNGAEPSTNGVFTVSFPSGVTYPEIVTVNYSVTGTATAGTDYTALSGTMTIPAGSNSATIAVPVIDDQLIEGNETVIVTLTSASAPSFSSFTATSSATVTIADDEAKSVSITAYSDATEPATNGAFRVNLPYGVTAIEDVTVTYSVSGTATPGDDYTALTGTVTIPAGSNYASIPLVVMDDQIIEPDETVILTLTGASATTLGTFALANTSATGQIHDNENRTVTITKATDGSEPATNGAFIVSLPTGVTATQDITVTYSVTGTATAGDDYLALSGTATILAGENSAQIDVVVNNDQIIEGNETVIATLTGATGTGLGTFTSVGAATVTITDDEDQTVTIAATADATEPATNGEFTVSLPAGVTATEDITVTYTVTGTATAGSDYTTLSGTVTIPAGSNNAAFSVDVLADNIIEADETVVATLTGASATTLGTFTATSTATVTIIDGSDKTISIATTADGAEPSTNGGFVVSLPTGVTATTDITVTYSVGGTATAGSDYTALTGTVVIPAGVGSVSVAVDVLDDNIIEADESVIVTLTGATATGLSGFTANAAATVMIADDEGHTISIAKTADGAEPSTNGAFELSLPGGLTATEDITVYYTVTGTATGGADYTALSGVATIPAGSTSVGMQVNVLDDQMIEGDETVVVTLNSATTNNLGTFTANGAVTVTITDDESKAVSIVASVPSASEPATNGAFVVSLPAGVTATEDVTVTYNVSGTATAGDDYTALTGTVVIPAGSNSATITVGVLDDQIIEADETVTATLMGASGSTLGAFTVTGTATVTIADDEVRTVSIGAYAYGSEPATNGAFLVSLPAGVIATEDITVNYSVAGTATAGSDYTTLSGTALIPAGSNSVSVSVDVLDDLVIEGDETVIATLTGASGATLGTFTATGTASVTIVDNESKTISIAATTAASEPATSGEFTISLPAGVTAIEDISVTYTVTGSATAGVDYTALSGTATIPAGANSVTVSVDVIDDMILEGDETVVATLTSASGATLGAFTASSAATMTLADDESKTVSIAKSADGSEPYTNGSFVVSLPTGVTTTEDVAVTYSISGTATAGDDYNVLSGTATILAGNNSVTITVGVNDDQILEGDETVIATLTGASTTSLGALTANTSATVMIADDENRTINLTISSNAAEPSANGGFVLSLAAGVTATQDITVTYSVGGTATAGSDYTALSGSAVIPAGASSVSVPVDVVDDQIIEGNETVLVTLTGATGTGLGTLTANQAVVVTIADDEERTVSIANAGDAAEPSTNGGFTVSLPAGVTASEDITVSYSVGGSATAGSDYTALSGSVIIPAGSNSVGVAVDVLDDQVIEGDETVVVTLTGVTASGTSGTALGVFTLDPVATAATVTIADDEVKTVSIANAGDAAEPSTNGAFTVSLPTGVTATEDIAVAYTIAGTATAGNDYSTLSGTVTISAGLNSANISVNVLNDQIIEGDETVIVTLSGATATGLGTFTLDPAATEATVTIADDEVKTVSITNAGDAAEPSTSGSFAVSLPTGVTATEDITVTYTVAGTATAGNATGNDYTSLSGTVTIPAGSNSATISVDVLDDQLIEGNETVIVTLTGATPSGASGTALGTFTLDPSATEATVTITDNESRAVSIVNAGDAAEPSTNGSFTVSLPTGVTATEDITVTYTVAGTATAGSASGNDYTALSGTVTIPAGSNSATVSIDVLDDQIIEGDETVVVTLTGATPSGTSGISLGAFTLNAAATEATVTIADDENKTVSIVNAGDASEPSTNGAFTVSLPTGVTAAEDITVTYTVAGTATAGSASGNDYTALSGTVIIPAGSNSATISVDVLDDQIIEGDETVIVTLTGATATSLGAFNLDPSATAATVTIADDEDKTVSIINAGDAAEPSTNGAFTVSLPTGVTAAADITVTYTVAGTATSGNASDNDYTALTGTVTIPAGSNSATISLDVLDDQIIEGDETVIVTLTGATPSGTGLGAFTLDPTATAATVTIADDENKTVSIVNTTDASEPSTNGSFTVSLPTGVTATEDITVTYTVAGTATAGNASGNDYTALSGTVIIPAGSNSATISVDVLDDQMIEGDETVIVTLTGATATSLGVFTLNPSATVATVTIADDENKTISITNAGDAAEPSTNGAFTVSLPAGVTATEDITVTYIVAGTATAGSASGNDYTALSGTVTIPAGSNSATISVDVLDDQIIEGDETVIVTLTGATATSLGAFTLDPAATAATVTIADDENKTVSIVNAGDAAEPSTNGAFTVSLPTGVTASEDITVIYTVAGTATAGTASGNDYTTLTGTVTIPAGSNSATISVDVLDDQIIEDDETVIVTLTGASGTALGSFTLDPAATAATVTIADDENKTISIVKSTDAAEPSTDGVFTVSLPTGVTATEDITVTYTVAGTATAGNASGNDYNALSGTVTIPAGSNSANIHVDVLDDQIIETDETVIVTLTGATATNLGAFTLDPSATTATVTIADNDAATITITKTADAAEPATNGQFTVSLPTGVTAIEDITVNYTISGTSTATAGTDYTTLGGTVTIPAGQTSATIAVNVIDDNIYEGDETVIANLTNAFGTTLGTITVAGNATVTIADDDAPTLTVTTTNDAAEPNTNGLFTVSLPTGITSTQDVTATYTITGTATAGDDYTSLNGTVTIPAGSNSATISVAVLDDQLIEGDETVIITINDATASSATLTIADDEDRTISIVNAGDAAEPSTNGAFTVSLPAGVTATEDIAVTYTVAGNATAGNASGNDYIALSGTVTIPAGSNSATISVDVLDDQIVEGDETVVVTLTGATGNGPSGAGGSGTSGLGTFALAPSATEATVTIADDEDKTISIVNAGDASEPSTNGAFTVSLPTGVTAAEDITVTYTVAGTATAGNAAGSGVSNDYTALSGTVTIPAGSNSATIFVDVLDDQIIEGDETVIVTLTGATPSGASGTGLGTFTLDPAATTATVTIADDEDKTISIVNTTDASEPSTNGAFTISLPTGVTAAEDITVTYSVAGTATAGNATGNDYTTLSGSATIPAGSNSATISVDVLDDQIIEGDETVIVTLTGATPSGASGGGLGTFTLNPAATTATVTIADDEDKTISIVNTTDASEPSTNGAFTVSLPTGVTAAEDITVTYSVAGTATAGNATGNDYTALSGSVTIPAGSNSATISVDVLDDQIIEGDETVVVTLTGATPSGASGTSLGTFTLDPAATTATVTIADDEDKIISIVNTTDASEPSTNGVFTVSLPTGVTATEDITVTYTVAGTATAGNASGNDYTALTGTFTIPAGSNSANISVDVLDDKIIEGDETVIVTLTGATANGTSGAGASGLGTFTLNPSATTATVTIADDDIATITLTKSADAAEPSTNGSFMVSLPTGLTSINDITVTYTVTGTATAGTDYTTLSGTATIPAGDNSATINVAVLDDKIIEGNETVIATINDATASTATLTIADDDVATISIIKTTDAAEPATNGAFTVSLPTGVTASEDITVTYTVAGTATAGNDYTSLNGTVTIPAGSNSTTLSVDVLDDQIIEGDETVIVTLTGATATGSSGSGSSGLGTFTLDPSATTATVTIADNDVATISITKTTDAAEPATNGVFTVSLPTGMTSATDITIPYTVSGTATAGTDYTTLTGTVTIPAGSNNAVINVIVTDDYIIEGNETVIVTLTDPAQTATVTITDNDLPTFTVVKTADAAEPSTNGSFTVSYPTNTTAPEDVTITYTVSGSATAGTDYTALTGTVVIPAGSNSATIAVNVIDDQLYEGDENVTITLTGAHGTTMGSLTATGTATLLIADNEVPTLSIVKTADAAEPSTNGAVVISAGTGFTATSDITITYTIAGTATNGTDYTTLSGTAIIPAGTNSVTVPVNVIDNYKSDGTRTVILTLTGGTDGTNNFQLSANSSATVNITDNDVASFEAWKVAILPANNKDGYIQPGEIITYKIYVRNTSTAAIGPLTITDKIPTNTNWESGWTLSGGVVTFPITTLAAGGVTEVTFQVKTYENLEGVDWINNTAYVSDGVNKLPSYACDPKTGSCDTITSVPVRASKGDLTITKTTVNEGPYVSDDYITYKIVVQNAGLSSFTKLVITDSLPYNLDMPYQTTTTQGTSTTSTSPRKVTWRVDKLEPGDSVVITVTSRILSGDKVTNTAYVYANEGEADYVNNIATNTQEIASKDLYFINAFRPGGTQNNKFVIVGLDKYPGSHLLVYSRWGNVVYEATSYNNDWTADNIPMGEYIYKVIVPKKTGKVTYTGTVLIIK